jgi:hypothetical protein
MAATLSSSILSSILSTISLHRYCFEKVMSSIITVVLSSTVGLLCDKARDSAANKLNDGDLSEEKGGPKSMLRKAERLENIMPVLFINHALYDFSSKYSSKSPNPFTWPGIELKDRTFHPILNTPEMVMKASSSEELVQQLN